MPTIPNITKDYMNRFYQVETEKGFKEAGGGGGKAPIWTMAFSAECFQEASKSLNTLLWLRATH